MNKKESWQNNYFSLPIIILEKTKTCLNLTIILATCALFNGVCIFYSLEDYYAFM